MCGSSGKLLCLHAQDVDVPVRTACRRIVRSRAVWLAGLAGLVWLTGTGTAR
ncbi:hypothetical protein PYCCODRAFT_1438280 [Trametes coccinea BRFM310]|uniref:Uncharacterized protein n=1 Tax=Trametes coccinea (strain BRFM310) TaxID=1353009 RepID=A0A1Y2IEF9_TRAC3|nr:hypothetical protein PYCCODRAFT_1438280 [Trametes coccinea BRFM310]